MTAIGNGSPSMYQGSDSLCERPDGALTRAPTYPRRHALPIRAGTGTTAGDTARLPDHKTGGRKAAIHRPPRPAY
jgi:hypothetical protein